MQVAALQLQNLRSNERLSASAEKHNDLSAESQRIQLHNQLLMKCVGELTAITKRKEGTIEQLRHCIKNAEKLADIPLPPTEQVLLPCTLFLVSISVLFEAHRLHCYCARSFLPVLVYGLKHTGFTATVHAFFLSMPMYCLDHTDFDRDCSNQSICCTSSISSSLHVAYDIRYLLCCGFIALLVPNSNNNTQAQHLEDSFPAVFNSGPMCAYRLAQVYDCAFASLFSF